jgi:predicted ArsR family transcriptional regulator
MKSTRDRILQTLLRKPSSTINDLALAVGINPISVRHHLTNLQVEGLVDAEEERHGVGRPRLVYSLTEHGMEKFPTRYLRLTSRLLDQLKSTLPQPMVSRLFAEMASSLADEYSEQMQGLEHGRTPGDHQRPAWRGRLHRRMGKIRRSIPDPRDHLSLSADRAESP